jgi:hypothetical protein
LLPVGARVPDAELQLKPRIAQAFAGYVHATEIRNQAELKSGSNFFWIDVLPETQKAKAYAGLAKGEVQLQQRNEFLSGQEYKCPDCMVHHWVGLTFIPRAHLEDVLRVLQNYDQHASYYAPDVERSRLELRDGDHYKIFLRFHRQKVITVVLNTEHDVDYFHDSPQRAHSRSSATRIAEVENPGRPSEREKSRGEDNGFLWGMETWWRMEERDGGVYVQSEAVSLTRSIPAGLAWMVGPFVTSIPKESLTFTLEATRREVLKEIGTANARAGLN